ncbi:hypothetical protein B7767_29125, partial [Streptomyces sp. 13-12-16]
MLRPLLVLVESPGERPRSPAHRRHPPYRPRRAARRDSGAAGRAGRRAADRQLPGRDPDRGAD